MAKEPCSRSRSPRKGDGLPSAWFTAEHRNGDGSPSAEDANPTNPASFDDLRCHCLHIPTLPHSRSRSPHAGDHLPSAEDSNRSRSPRRAPDHGENCCTELALREHAEGRKLEVEKYHNMSWQASDDVDAAFDVVSKFASDPIWWSLYVGITEKLVRRYYNCVRADGDIFPHTALLWACVGLYGRDLLASA